MINILSKTIIIQRVVEMIAKKYGMTLKDARDAFYNSKVLEALNDEETGLYGQSPLYIFSLFEIEFKK